MVYFLHTVLLPPRDDANLCSLWFKLSKPLARDGIYEYTSEPWRRTILDMSRGNKSKAVSGEKGSPPQDESGSGDLKIAERFRMMKERFQKQDNKFESFHEDIKNTTQRLEELQLRVPRPRLADMGIQERKSGELEEITTETGGRRKTPPEPQRP